MFERRVTLEEFRALSPRYFVLSYRCPEIARASCPGQFVMISAAEAIDPLLRRPMAIYRIVRQGSEPVGFSLLVEAHGRGTRLMSRFRPGDAARVLGPLGRPFAADAEDDALEHLLIMGGVGAAPFPFLAESLRGAGARVRAFVGGRTRADLLCVDDFESLEVPVHAATEDGSAGHRGFVTGALEQYLDGSGALARLYSCGPTAMMHAVDDIARARRLHHQVSLEAPMACGIGVCLSCVVRVGEPEDWDYRRICREGPVFDASTLVWS